MQEGFWPVRWYDATLPLAAAGGGVGGRAGARAIAATAARFWGYRATCKQVFILGTAMLQHIPQLSKMEA